MHFDPNDFDNGIKLGTDRVRDKLNDPSLTLSPTSRTQISRVLINWPQNLHGRFVELFVEMATVASVGGKYIQSRSLSTMNCSPLSLSSSFFNSFKHR